MNFKLLNNYSFNDIVLFDSNHFFSKKELIQIFETEYSFVKNRDLVVIICENNIENYILFLALITKGAIPILVDKKYNKKYYIPEKFSKHTFIIDNTIIYEFYTK